MTRRSGRRPPRRRAWSLALSALLAATLAAGCGDSANETANEEPTTTANAVEVEHDPRDRWTYARAHFREMCEASHSLADAGTTWPRFNLDGDPEINDQLVRETI